MSAGAENQPVSRAAGVRGLFSRLMIVALVAATTTATSAGCERAIMADLIIESVCYRPAEPLGIPGVGIVGERLVFSIRIKNIGDAPASGELYIDMGKSAEELDKHHLGKGSRIKEDEPSIAPGEVFETSLKATISIGAKWNKVYFLLNPEMEIETFTMSAEGDIEVLDAYRYRLEESNYRNNTYELEILPHIKPSVRNVDDTAFTVIWTSDNAETGYVNYGTTADNLDRTAQDIRGKSTKKRSHHVAIAGLSASTTYYYEFVSSGTTYRDYCDAAFEVTTGPNLPPRMPDMISGNVYNHMTPTDITAEARAGVRVYIQGESSQTLSALVDDSGAWSLGIGSIRTADYESYFMYSDADKIDIFAYFIDCGGRTWRMTIAEARAMSSDRTLPDATK